MKKENKVLLSLLPYNKEDLKLEMLKDEASFKEIMRAIRYYRCENIDERIDNINEYNTVFFSECDYPKILCNLKIPPMRIQSTSSFPKDDEYKIGLVSSQIILHEEYNLLTDFVLDVLRNNITIMSLGNNSSGCIENLLNDLGATNYCLLTHGIDNSSSAKSILLSPYEPMQVSNKSMRLSMYEVFGIICNAVVLFEIYGGYDIYNVISSTLDCGGTIYLSRVGMHCNKTSNPVLKLLLDGAPIISNLCDIENFKYDYLNHKVVCPTTI